MSDTSVPEDTVQVTTCDTDETLAATSGLFNQYRHHYGEPSDAAERPLDWLACGLTSDRPGDRQCGPCVAGPGTVLAVA